jgi:UDP-2-acetamido-3-amino-2,3-dideoxy-glucuronate N-acetyltransferase
MNDLALIGGGYWGKNLARNFFHLGTLRAICDPHPDTLRNFADHYPAVELTTSYEDILSNPNIQKVAIAAPAALHYQLAKRALLADKHVYVEKPLCLSPHEGQDLIDLANGRSRILMVGHLLQYHPCVTELRKLVDAGELGQLFYITSNRLNLGKIRSEENALWSFAPHDISVILAIAGALPESVQCVGEHYLTRGVADTTLTQMSFTNGLKAHIHVSWMNPFKEQKLTVVGSEGMVVFDDTKPWGEKLLLFKDYLAWEQGQVPVAKKTNGLFLDISENEPLKAECEHFLSCCEKGAKPLTDGCEGLRVLQVLDAAQRSMEQDGKRVAITPIKPKPSVFFHPTAIVDEGAEIGDGTNIWHFSHVSSKSSLGKNCNLGQNVFIATGVLIGNNVKIQNNVSVYSGTEIHDDVFLGPSCVLTNVSNPRSQVNRKSIYERTVIQRGATVGANATIVCGVTLGRYSFIAAGAVVTSDVPDYALMMGVPAKQKGWMSRHGHLLEFDDQDEAKCPESGLRYHRVNTGENSFVRCLDIGEDCALPTELAYGKTDYRSVKQVSSTNANVKIS